MSAVGAVFFTLGRFFDLGVFAVAYCTHIMIQVGI